MNDAQRYRMNAAECLSAAGRCELVRLLRWQALEDAQMGSGVDVSMSPRLGGS
jgi:hypothetical protein